MKDQNRIDTAYQYDTSIDLVKLFYRILDKSIIIVITTLLCAVVLGKTADASSTVVYYSTAKLYLLTSNNQTISMSDIQTANYLINDYFALFQTKELHERVANEVKLGYTSEMLSNMITVTNPTDTHIINITVRADSPEDAKLIANAYADITGSFAKEKLNVPYPMLFEKATSASKNIISNAKQNYIIGAMIGLFVSCLIVVFRGIFDDRVFTPEDLREAFGIETLGVITEQKRTAIKEVNNAHDPDKAIFIER